MLRDYSISQGRLWHHHHELYIPSRPNARRPMKLLLKRPMTTTNSKRGPLHTFQIPREPSRTAILHITSNSTIRSTDSFVMPSMFLGSLAVPRSSRKTLYGSHAWKEPKRRCGRKFPIHADISRGRRTIRTSAVSKTE